VELHWELCPFAIGRFLPEALHIGLEMNPVSLASFALNSQICIAFSLFWLGPRNIMLPSSERYMASLIFSYVYICQGETQRFDMYFLDMISQNRIAYKVNGFETFRFRCR
jgi:hypothetical protein